MKKSRILFWIITTAFVLSSPTLALLIPNDNSGTNDNSQYQCDENGNLAQCTSLVECANVYGANFDCVRNKCVYKGSQGPCSDGTAIGQCSKKSPGLRCIEGPLGSPSIGKVANDPCCTGGTTPTTQSNGCNNDGWCNPAYGETILNCPIDCTCNNNGKCDPPTETPQTCKDCEGITPDNNTNANYFKDKTISTEEYNRVYFVIYQDRVTKGTKFSDNELSDIIDYFKSNEKDLSGNLYTKGSKSNEIIGTILMRAGANFGTTSRGTGGGCYMWTDVDGNSCCHDDTNWPGYCYTGEICDTSTGFCKDTGGTTTTSGGGTTTTLNINKCTDGTLLGQCSTVKPGYRCTQYGGLPVLVWDNTCHGGATTTSVAISCPQACGNGGWPFWSCAFSTCISPAVSMNTGSCAGYGSGTCCCSNTGSTTSTTTPPSSNCMDSGNTAGYLCSGTTGCIGKNNPGNCYIDQCKNDHMFVYRCDGSGNCVDKGYNCGTGACADSTKCLTLDRCDKACMDKGYKYYNCDYNTCSSPLKAELGVCTGLGAGSQCCCTNGGTTTTKPSSPTTTQPSNTCPQACGIGGYPYYTCAYSICQSPLVGSDGSCTGLGIGRCCCSASSGVTTTTTPSATTCDYACGTNYKFYTCGLSSCVAPTHAKTASCSGLGSGVCCCHNCGNGYCSSVDGETAANCPEDCAASTTTQAGNTCPQACGIGGYPYYTCAYSICQSPLVGSDGSCTGLGIGRCCCSKS